MGNIHINPVFNYYQTAFSLSEIYNLIFRCLSRGETPPVKDRLEYPVPNTQSGWLYLVLVYSNNHF